MAGRLAKLLDPVYSTVDTEEGFSDDDGSAPSTTRLRSHKSWETIDWNDVPLNMNRFPYDSRRAYNRYPRVFNAARWLVRKNRRAYSDKYFTLDLAYITDRIIAMGYPGIGAESYYRNDWQHQQRFLERYHHGHYRVFNLRGATHLYDENIFDGRVTTFRMEDHEPPRLEMIAVFCRMVHEYLSQDKRNVVAVHCKAGKGRTGVMICAYLQYIKFYPKLRQIMDYYSIVRTENFHGLTIPSQRRYLYYFEHMRDKKLNYLPYVCKLVGIYVQGLPNAAKTDKVELTVTAGDIVVFNPENVSFTQDTVDKEKKLWVNRCAKCPETSYDPDHPEDPQENNRVLSRRAWGWTMPADKPLYVEGDIGVRFRRPELSGKHKKFAHFYFNTMFVCPTACGDVQYRHGDGLDPYPNDDESLLVKKKTSVSSKPSTSHVAAESNSSNTNQPSTSGTQAKQSKDPGQSAHRPTRENLRIAEKLQRSFSPPPRAADIKAKRVADGKNGPDGNSQEDAENHPEDAQQAPVPQGEQDVEAIPDETRKASATHDDDSDDEDEAIEEPTQDNVDSGSGLPAMTIHQKKSIFKFWKNQRDVAEFQAKEDEKQYYKKWDVQLPSNENQHCAEEDLSLVHHKRIPPRFKNRKLIRKAHEEGVVKDKYQRRKMKIEKDNESTEVKPVKAARAYRPFNGEGPALVRRQLSEHVLYFPIYELDNAVKRDSIPDVLAVYVLLECIDPRKANPVADKCIQELRDKQAKFDEEVVKKKLTDSKEGQFPGDPLMYHQDNNKDLDFRSSDVVDPRNTDGHHMQRFFFRQRADSHSQYLPNPLKRCKMLDHEDDPPLPDGTIDPNDPHQQKDDDRSGEKKRNFMMRAIRSVLPRSSQAASQPPVVPQLTLPNTQDGSSGTDRTDETYETARTTQTSSEDDDANRAGPSRQV